METHAFYVVGGALAVWALLVSGLGVLRKDFPSSAPAEIAVAVISLALVLGAIGSAIHDASNEQKGEEGGGHEAAQVLPR